MHITLWPSLTASTGASSDVPWKDFLAFVARPETGTEKTALEGWSPVSSDGDRRGADYVREVFAIVLDDDASGMPIARLRELWSAFGGVIHTSFSHTATNPKHRLVFPSSRPMSAAEHARVWRYFRDVAASFGQPIDEATKDASRLWFVPAHRPGAPYEWVELKGRPFDVDAVLALVPEEAITSTPANATKSPMTHAKEAITRRHMAADILGKAWPEKGRHQAQRALAGALYTAGYSQDDALDFLCSVTRAAGDEDRPKRIATVRDTYERGRAGGSITGWTTLNAHVDGAVVDAARKLATWGPMEDAHARHEPSAVIEKSRVVVTSPWPTPAERARKVGGHDLVRLATGLPSIDLATRGGLLARKVVALGGAPGAGKTAMQVQLAYRWLCEGVRVAFLAADEDADAILIRFGQLAGLSRDGLENGVKGEREALARWCEGVPLMLIDGDEEDVTIEKVSGILKDVAAGAPSALMVDSIQTARSDVPALKGGDLRARINETVRALKRAAKVDGHVVVATSEISKAAYRNKDQAENINPLSAFKESGDIEYGVGLALVLTSKQGTSDYVDAVIAKNRLGPGKPAFVLKLDHVRAGIEETTEGAAAVQDPTALLRMQILSAVRARAGACMTKSQIAGCVGGGRTLAYSIINDMITNHDLHEETRGVRLPLPSEPGYREQR